VASGGHKLWKYIPGMYTNVHTLAHTHTHTCACAVLVQAHPALLMAVGQIDTTTGSAVGLIQVCANCVQHIAMLWSSECLDAWHVCLHVNSRHVHVSVCKSAVVQVLVRASATWCRCAFARVHAQTRLTLRTAMLPDALCWAVPRVAVQWQRPALTCAGPRCVLLAVRRQRPAPPPATAHRPPECTWEQCRQRGHQRGGLLLLLLVGAYRQRHEHRAVRVPGQQGLDDAQGGGAEAGGGPA